MEKLDKRTQAAKKIWMLTGITEHLGGIRATQQLISNSPILSQSTVLDVGCGTGYTVRLLAAQQPKHILAFDLLHNNCQTARHRLAGSPVLARVIVLQGDAHEIPLPNASVDMVFIESVLVFCDLPNVLKELKRILKPGGQAAINEMTYLKHPPADFQKLLKEISGESVFTRAGWVNAFTQAGFEVLSVSIFPIKMMDQFISHMAVDGPIKYFKGVISGLREPAIWRQFMNRKVLKMLRIYRQFIGYGLYLIRSS